MNRLLKIALPLAVVALALALRAWLMNTAPQPPPAGAPAAASVVEVHAAQLGAHRLQVSAHGELRAERSLALAAELGGRVIWIAPGLADGGVFRAGEELLRLDPTDAEQALAGARAERARAAAALAIEAAAAASARQDWEAFGSGDASPLALREPQVALARAGLEAAEAALARAETALARCVIRAPFAGRCAQRLAVPGAVIAPGSALALLQSGESFEARIVLSQSELRRLELHASAPFAPLAALIDPGYGDGTRWPARLIALEPALDARNLTARAVFAVTLPDASRPPLSGGFVQALIDGPELRDVALVPRAALQDDGRVWRVDADDRLRLAHVEIAAETPDGVLLRGIAEGDRLCLTPLPLAVEGMRVVPRALE